MTKRGMLTRGAVIFCSRELCVPLDSFAMSLAARSAVLDLALSLALSSVSFASRAGRRMHRASLRSGSATREHLYATFLRMRMRIRTEGRGSIKPGNESP